MHNTQKIQKETGGYISTLLRDYFGKGPSSVFVTVNKPFVTFYLSGFLSPTERILLKQNETRRILETRDLLMNDLEEEIKLQLQKIAQLEIKEIYADWNLDMKTGMIIAVMDNEDAKDDIPWPEAIDKESFHDKVNLASKRAQKTPESTESYWLSDRTILIRRQGIFVEIEKELIKGGFIEELKLVKRPLERGLLEKVNLEEDLNQQIQEMFFDWNFETDKGYTVILLAPTDN